MDWTREITIAALVKQKVEQADIDQIWQHCYPSLGATEEELHDAEKRLGFALAEDHREFLKHTNGWDWFFQSVDIMGTSDFFQGPRLEKAEMLLISLACGTSAGLPKMSCFR